MTAAYKPKGGPATVIFTVFALLTMGSMLLLNLQPWFVIGRDIMSQIDTGPLLGIADWIIGGTMAKVVGIVSIVGAIRFYKTRKMVSAHLIIVGTILLLKPETLIKALGEIIGFLMWAWIQFIQVSPMLAQHSLIPASQKWMSQLKNYRAAAYLAEAIAVFIKYPPYAGGDINRLMNDLTSLSLSSSQWSWVNFFWALTVMMCVELTFKFLLKAGVYSGAFTKSKAQPATEAKTQQARKAQGPEGYKVYPY